MRGRVGGAADEADGADLLLRLLGADRGTIGHQLHHLLPGAVARIHRQEGDVRQVGTDGIGVIGGDTGRPDLLQEDRLQIDQMGERAGDVHHRIAGADPGPFLEVQRYVEFRAARPGHALQPLDGQPRCEGDRPPHEHAIGDPGVAKAADDLLALQEVFVRQLRDVVDVGSHRRCSRPPCGGPVLPLVHGSLPGADS